MGLVKRTYTDNVTVITAENLNDIQDAVIALEGVMPDPSSATPQMDGTASAGISKDYSRTDHVHPSDTSKANKNDVEAALNSIAPEMTTFVKRQFDTYSDTLLSEIDSNVVTYTGYRFTESGGFEVASAFNSYAVKCPYDGFTFKSNGGRICVADGYPDTVLGTVSIKTVLTYTSDGDMTITRTIAKKGDIILFSVATSGVLYVLTQKNNLVQIDNLILKNMHDNFMLYSDIDNGLSVIGNKSLNITKVQNALINSSTGGYSSNASYDTYYFKVPVGTLTVKCTNGFRACISYKEPATTSQTTNLKTLLYNNSSGRVETFTANFNEWVVITVAHSAGDIVIYTDYMNRFTMPALRLDYRQSDSFYKYVVSGTSKYLYIYYKSGGKYVRWELHNVPALGSNSNTWQIGKVCGYDEDLTNEIELVAAGEFELAFKEHGAADFCGGNNHGDETTDSFLLFIDGKQFTDLTVSTNDYVAFNRIDAIEIATVNRCDTPSEDILKHQKVWSFENGTVKVKQSLQFLETLQVDGMLICMFAANRSSFKYGVRQGRVGIETMTDSSYSSPRTKINDMFYEMYGEHVTAKIKANSFNENGDSGLWINPTSVLNKLYFTYWESSNSTYPVTVQANTILHWESEYDVAYN